MKVTDEPLTLKATIGARSENPFLHLDRRQTHRLRDARLEKMGQWIERDYPIPQELLKGKTT